MKVEVIREPVFCLKIRDFFTESVNKAIIEEALANESKFETASTVDAVDDYRVNLLCSYDKIYANKRDESALITALQTKFTLSDEFASMLSSSEFPLSEFKLTNNHETQVSRYGEGGHYFYHIDRNDKVGRLITVIYYFFKEPKAWSGGELCITNSLAHNSKLIEENPNIKTIMPENNMAVIFSTQILHCVLDTKSPKEFDKGRFSANIWLGIRR